MQTNHSKICGLHCNVRLSAPLPQHGAQAFSSIVCCSWQSESINPMPLHKQAVLLMRQSQPHRPRCVVGTCHGHKIRFGGILHQMCTVHGSQDVSLAIGREFPSASRPNQFLCNWVTNTPTIIACCTSESLHCCSCQPSFCKQPQKFHAETQHGVHN